MTSTKPHYLDMPSIFFLRTEVGNTKVSEEMAGSSNFSAPTNMPSTEMNEVFC